MRFSKRIISFVTVFATLVSLLTVSASAAENPQPSCFVEWGYAYSTAFADTMQSVLFDECPEADDGNHDAASYLQDLDGVYFLCSCARCGQNFIGVASGDGYVSDGSYNLAGGGASRADVLAAAYDTYVSGLPVTNVTSGSSFSLYNGVSLPALPADAASYPYFFITGRSGDYYWLYATGEKFALVNTCLIGGTGWMRWRCNPEAQTEWESNQSSDAGLYTGKYITYLWSNAEVYGDIDKTTVLYEACGDPLFFAAESEAEAEYGIAATSRPTSITGNYGIVGDDGSVTNIGTQTIVNEGDSTYYNPVTNTSYDLSGWTYDYSTRTYDLSTTEGDTITVEYGDETVNITEGDTVYNVYYLVEEDTSSGDDDESTGDEDCDHTYTSETTKAATCLLAGKETFTCSECGDTYTKTIPAAGHDWSVLQSVTSQYDDTGALVTEGYTIYQCSSCGEQYKSTDGSAPPGGSSSSGGTIWEKIGTLFGTIADGVIGMIETALSKILDALISLAEMLTEKFNSVIDAILSLFDRLPDLFGGFTSLLSAVFPFLPQEILDLLFFGLIAFVFAALFRYLTKGK